MPGETDTVGLMVTNPSDARRDQTTQPTSFSSIQQLRPGEEMPNLGSEAGGWRRTRKAISSEPAQVMQEETSPQNPAAGRTHARDQPDERAAMRNSPPMYNTHGGTNRRYKERIREGEYEQYQGSMEQASYSKPLFGRMERTDLSAQAVDGFQGILEKMRTDPAFAVAIILVLGLAGYTVYSFVA